MSISRLGPAYTSARHNLTGEWTHVVLSKFDTGSVPLDNLLDQIGNSRLVLESTRMVPFNPSIIRGESTLDGVLQNGKTVGAHFSVILDVLDEPPCLSAASPIKRVKLTRTITTIVPWIPGRVEQVGNQTVLECSSKRKNMVPSSGEVASGEEQATERDEL